MLLSVSFSGSDTAPPPDNVIPIGVSSPSSKYIGLLVFSSSL